MVTIMLIALACAAVSFTITTTSIFEAIREFVSGWHSKVDELIHCPWCLNHYISFLAVLYTGYAEVSDYVVLNFIITWFAVVAIGGLVHYVLLRAYKPVMKAQMDRKFRKMQNN